MQYGNSHQNIRTNIRWMRFRKNCSNGIPMSGTVLLRYIDWFRNEESRYQKRRYGGMCSTDGPAPFNGRFAVRIQQGRRWRLILAMQDLPTMSRSDGIGKRGYFLLGWYTLAKYIENEYGLRAKKCSLPVMNMRFNSLVVYPRRSFLII